MDIAFITGLIGSLILVTGAAWPESRDVRHPMRSPKNWLFTVGGAFMFLYAMLGYLDGGSVFFVLLQVLVAVSTLLMMLNTPDTVDTPILAVISFGLVVWSLYLFEGYNTVFFIVGLCTLGLGYAFQTGTLRREVSLTFGSALIAVFSYIEASWVFFWLNVFFAAFSGYYLCRALLKR